MKAASRSTQKIVRHAFGLLLEMRAHENAYQLLCQAVAFLEVLAREKKANAAPVLLSVRLLQLRRS